MTLNITGIAVDEPNECQPALKTNPIDQFWNAAGDVLIEVVNRQPRIRAIVEGVINAGGDIEITAHNQAGRISVTLAGPSGLRHIVLADARQMLL
jgi:hypothetical protein